MGTDCPLFCASSLTLLSLSVCSTSFSKSTSNLWKLASLICALCIFFLILLFLRNSWAYRHTILIPAGLQVIATGLNPADKLRQQKNSPIGTTGYSDGFEPREQITTTRRPVPSGRQMIFWFGCRVHILTQPVVPTGLTPLGMPL